MHVTYYFWIISDWAYLGGPRFESIAARHGLEVDFRPVCLPKVYAQTGGILLGQRSVQRQAHRVAELRRWRARLGMVCQIEPRFFPVDDGPASCLVIAAKRRGMALHVFVQAIMAAIWVDDADVSDRGTLRAIAARFVPDPDALLQEADGARDEYAGITDAAPADGVFGSPFYLFENEPFWGQDRLDMLEDAVIRAKAKHGLGRG